MTANIASSENIHTSKFVLPNFKALTPQELKQYMCLIADKMECEACLKAKLKDNINAAEDSLNPDKKRELEKAAIVMYIINKVVFPHAAEVVKGAHVMVEDGGALYDKLVKQNLVQNRKSSHHSNNKFKDNEGREASDVSHQGGNIFKEFLVGKTKDGKTWFQVEAHSLGGLANFIGHMIDYLKYKLSGKNVGQYGLSEHVDSKPINILKPHLDQIKLSVDNVVIADGDIPATICRKVESGRIIR